MVPATQQFGYFAPQVCSEFRLLVHLGSSQSGEKRDVHFSLSSEAELLLSSFNAQAQEEVPATVIAGSYAAYALNQHREFDFAFVEVQAEYLPPISEAAKEKPTWLTVRGYFFKK